MKTTRDFRYLKSRLICETEEYKAGLSSIQEIDGAINADRCARSYSKSEDTLKLNLCLFDTSDLVCGLRRSPRGLSPGNESHFEELRQMPENAQLVSQSRNPKQAEEYQVDDNCRQIQEEGEVFKKKIMQTNAELTKMVGNIVSHFYNGTEDAQQVGENIAEDLFNTKSVILIALLLTLIASLMFIYLMRCIAAPIIWLSIYGVLIGMAVAIYYTVKQYIFWRDTPYVANHGLTLDKQLQNLLMNPSTWLYLSIFLCVLFVVILLLVIVLRKRIHIAIAVTKEGSKAVSSVVSTVFFPIFSWTLYIAAIAFAIYIGLHLNTIGPLSFRMIKRITNGQVSTERCVCEKAAINYTVGASCDPTIFQQYCYVGQEGNTCKETTCSFVEIATPTLVNYFVVYNVFAGLWLSCFISAFGEMVLAATFARWYWTLEKKNVPYFTLTRAFFQTAFYHLGTLAFGSMILAICRLICLILEYIDKKVKKFDNAITRAILCCLRCFFWLLENFLRFINKNAYIMCAIHGKSFCPSAKDAFNLYMRNCLRGITLDKVTDFLFFLSKLLLTAGAGVSTYYFLASNPNIKVNYKLVPTIVVAIASYFMTSVFFSVYSMAVDTLFLCFLEDCERNDGSPQKPYFMAKHLMKILGKRNKLPKRQGRSK